MIKLQYHLSELPPKVSSRKVKKHHRHITILDQKNNIVRKTMVENIAGTVITKVLALVKVAARIPENVPDNIRQQKINKIYDLLNPETPGK